MTAEIDEIIALPATKEAYSDFLFSRAILRHGYGADDLVRAYERVGKHREQLDQIMATNPPAGLQPVHDIVAAMQDEVMARLSALVGEEAARAAVDPNRFSKRHPGMVSLMRISDSSISIAAYDRMLAGSKNTELSLLFAFAVAIFLLIILVALL